MVAIFTGSGMGLERGSGMVLGARGLLGQSFMGRAGENVFVNAANGNLVLTRTDEMLMGLGPNAALTRAYNSLANSSDDNGDNWRFGGSRRIHSPSGTWNAVGSSVIRTDWDGSETVYNWTSSNTYRTTDGAGAYDTLVFAGSGFTDTNGYWTWTDGDSRLTEVYNTPASGSFRLATQTDKDGKVVSFSYNGSGFLSKITTATVPSPTLNAPGVEYVEISYTGSNATEVTTYYQSDTDGAYESVKRVRYGYDASNRLTSVTVDLSPGDGSIADGKTYTITYGYVDATDRINLITQSDGSSIAITYWGDNKVKFITQTAASGVTRQTKFTYSANSTEVQDPFGQVTTLNYDSNGNLTSIVAPPAVAGASAQTYSFEYNTRGDVIKVIDPSGATTTYDDIPETVEALNGYDENGNRRLERGPNGITIRRTFNSANQILTETRYLTLDPDGPGTGSPTGPLTTRYVYDSENHLRYLISAEGRVTEYIYDDTRDPTVTTGAGLLTSVVDYTADLYSLTGLGAEEAVALASVWTWIQARDKTTSRRTDYRYDFRGQIDRTTQYGAVLSSGNGDTSVASEITQTYYIYDQAGNLLSRWTEGANTAETYLYDGLNRITASTDYAGLTTTITYGDSASTTTVTIGGALTRVSTYNLAGELIAYAQSGTGLSTVTTSYRYDALGRLRSITDPTQVKTYFIYDRVGRKVGEVDGNGTLTEFRYNLDNDLVSTTRYKTPVASGNLTSLDNNTANMSPELSAIRPASDGADIWEWRIYDTAHRLIQTINGAGAAVVYEYDGASRLVKTTSYATLIASGTVSGYKTTGPTGLVTPSADAANDRIVRSFYDADGRLLGSLDAEGYLTEIVYDAAGQRVETIAYNGATSVSLRAAGTFTQLRTSLTVDTTKDIHVWSVYDKRGLLLATIDGAGNVMRYQYTAQGFLGQEIRGQKLSASQLSTYLGGTRPSLANLPAAAGGTVLETTAWTRDRYGRILSEVRSLAGGVSETDVYLYDSAGRLLSVTTANGSAAATTTSYFYDARGRLIAQIGGEGSAVMAAHGNRRYDQTLVGTGSGERIDGGASNDLIQGLSGADSLYGYGGDDRLEGGAGADRLEGGDGNDIIVAGTNNDVNLYGGTGRDVFVFMSGDGADTIQDFEVGVDLIDLSAMGGYVSMAASGTTDTLITLTNGGTVTVKNVLPSQLTAANFLYGGYDQVTVGTSGNETLTGTAGRDLIQGLAGNDTLNGLGGDDRLEGGAGVDVMNGGDGADILISGTSNDVSLTGGTGRDIFVFVAGDGADVILDFELGVDLIDLTAVGGYVSMAASGSNTVITLSSGTITVNGVTPTALQAGHLLLSPLDVARTFGVTYSYDDGDRLIAQTTPNGSGVSSNKTLYVYDADGALLYEINPLGEVVEYRYDSFGRQTDVIAYGTRLSATTLATLVGGLVTSAVSTAVSGIASASVDSRVQSTYNVTGTLASRTDAEGVTTTFAYSSFDQLISQVDTLTLTANDSRTTTMAYDRRGLLASTAVDPSGLNLITSFGYDAFGRAITTTDPDGKVRATSYDRAGRTLTTTDPLNGVTTYSYDGRGQVVSIKDRLNNETTFAYTAFNRSVTMTTQEGIVTTQTMNAQGQTLTLADGAGRQTSFVYDRDGHLLKSTDGQGNQVQNSYDTGGRLSVSVDERGSRTRYTYDAVDRRLTVTVDDGGLALKTEYVYNAKGLTTRVIDPANRVVDYEFDLNGRTTTITTDPAGLALVTKYKYDLAGRTIKLTQAYGTTEVRATQYEFDKADRLTRTILDPVGLTLTTNYVYDKRGNAIARTDAAGKITRFVYDDDNRLIWSVDAAGGVTRTSYDAEGRVVATLGYAAVVSQTTLTSWGATPLTQTMITTAVSTSAPDHTVNLVYDRDGRLRYSVNALGRPTEYVYDGSGKVVRSVQYDGAIAPASWTLTAVAGAISSANLAAAAGTRTTRAVYNSAGRQAYAISAAGEVTSFAYDGAGNLIKTTRHAVLYSPSGDPSEATMVSWVATNASAANDRVSRNLYDGAGRLAYSAAQIDATVSAVSRIEYDASSQVLRETRYEGSYAVTDTTTLSALTTLIGAPTTAAVTSYTYDNGGRITDITDAEGWVTHMTYDALGQAIDTTRAYGTSAAATVRRVYDDAGRVTSETRGYGSAEASTTGYSYDGQGRVLVVTNPRGFTTTLTYDGEGRVLTQTVQLNSTQSAVTTNSYDAFGNLVRVIDARGNAGYFYYNRLDQLTRQVDPENYVTDTTYSLGGEVLTVKRFYNRATLSGTPLTTPPSDPAAHAKDATTTITRDKLDRVTQVTDAEGFYEAYTLNSFGDRITVRNKLGADTVNSFDKRGLLLTETLAVSAVRYDGQVLATSVVNRFEYDGRGNRTKAVEADNIAAEKRTTIFKYDRLDRLTEERGDQITVTDKNLVSTSTLTPTQKITYDALGNITLSEDAAGAKTFYYYDDLGRKTAQVDAAGTLSVWEYDAADNMTLAKVYGDAVSLPTNPGGAPPSPVNSANLRQTSYSYDRNNRRVGSSISGVTTGSFDGTNYVVSTAAITTAAQYDAMGNVVLETDARGNGVFHFYDKRGKETARVDQEGYLTSYSLDAEGNVLTEERFAAKPSGAVSITSDPAALRTSVTFSAADRTTSFTYDRLGQRLSEARSGVVSASVNGSGVMTTTTATSTISYSYNGLGLVTRKTEATGDYIDFTYDNLGREITATTSAFTDHAGVSVQRRTDTAYSGLGQVSRTREGKVAADTAIDRITQYVYGAGGRLASVTDANGFVRSYGYDAVGRVMKESYSRLKSDGTSVTEANAYQYDALGRVMLQASAAYSGSVWTFGDVTQIGYNSYGEVKGKAIVGGSTTTPAYQTNLAYQETFAYDAAGRLWKSNTGDGVTRVYLYDAAGNMTLTINPLTTDLSGYGTVGDVLTGLGTSGATGQTALAGIAPTIMTYDKRGMATATREPFREISSSSGANLIVRSRTYNAFGEVASETDARGNTTDYGYNTMGRLIQRQAPTVSYTLENGAITSGRPTETYSYDLAGRLVGTRDANGNLNRRTLLAHTGYGENSEALVLADYHAGGSDSANSGVYQSAYDVLGNLRKRTNELGVVTTLDYDKLGRLITLNHPTRTANSATLKDEYSYDGLGQRITHSQTWRQVDTTDLDNDSDVTELTPWTTSTEKTDYDLQGRVVKFVDYGGYQTLTNYSWSATVNTSGLGDFDGHIKTTTHVSGLTATENLDYFGRLVGRTDLGAHSFAMTFDKAGRMITETQSGGGKSLTYSWYDTGLMASITDSSASIIYGEYDTYISYSSVTVASNYTYDLEGNRVNETLVTTVTPYSFNGSTYTAGTPTSTTHQDLTASWDAMGRMTGVVDNVAGNSLTSVAYEYDAAGNVRRVNSAYTDLVTGNAASQDYWYLYDSQNRFVVTKGTLSGGVIGRGANGVEIAYDLAGNRVSALSTVNKVEYTDNAQGQPVAINYKAQHREEFLYTEDGYLSQVKIAEGQYAPNLGTGIAVAGAATVRATDLRDGLGRLISHSEFSENGTAVYSRYAIIYSATNQVLSDKTASLQNNAIFTTSTTNNYNALSTTAPGVAAGAYMGGVVTQTTTTTTKLLNGNTTNEPGTDTKTTYLWWDSAQQNVISYDKDTGNSSNNLWTSSFDYDANGHLGSVVIDDGRDRTVNYTTDAQGQILSRIETSAAATNPKDLFYYFDGVRIGDVSNNGTSETDYATAINNRTSQGTGRFRNGSTTQISYADFDQSYDPINPSRPGAVAGDYTVQEGDNLQTIAQTVWGDASLWYLIADANGLNSASLLVGGMTLVIPSKVANIHNTGETFRPYDPNKAMGEISPTQAKPPPKAGGCGAGGIIIALIAVVVAAIVAPYAIAAISNLTGATAGLTGAQVAAALGQGSTLFAGAAAHAGTATVVTAGTVVTGATFSLSATSLIVGGAIAGAAGSIASQAFGVATGQQDRLSWNAVAMSAFGAGVGAGLSAIPAASNLISSFGNFANVARGAAQSVITQGVGVATGLQDRFDWAGVAVSAITAGVGGALGEGLTGKGFALELQKGAVGLIGGIAGAATRSLIEGSSFGDNLITALPSVIGSTIGNAIAGGLSAQPSGNGDSKSPIGSLFGAAGDVLGFDGQFGYQGDANGQRALSLAGLGHAVGNVAGMVGDVTGFDGEFGYQGAPKTLLALDGSNWPGRTTTDAPTPYKTKPKLSLGNFFGAVRRTAPALLAVAAEFLGELNDKAADDLTGSLMDRFGFDKKDLNDWNAVNAYAAAEVLSNFDNPLGLSKGAGGRSERIGVMLLERALPGTFQDALAGDADALLMMRGVVAEMRPKAEGVGQKGFIDTSRTQAERLLVENMRAARADSGDIQTALALHRIANDGSASAAPARGDAPWLQRVKQGVKFNQDNYSRYTYREVYIRRDDGSYVVLDSYDPATREIVSRKFTQLGGVKSSTAIGYIREAATKYPPGAKIAGVNSTKPPLRGQVLVGDVYLEVPYQNYSIPQSVLDAASKYDVIIRDVNGKIYK